MCCACVYVRHCVCLCVWVTLKVAGIVSNSCNPLSCTVTLISNQVYAKSNPVRHLHLSLNHKGHWGTTNDFLNSFLHFSRFSTAFWGLPNFRPVHSLILSSHLFFCLPCFLSPFTVPCKMVLAIPDEHEWETFSYYCSLHFFTMVKRSLCGPTACWTLAHTSLLEKWCPYEMQIILR